MVISVMKVRLPRLGNHTLGSGGVCFCVVRVGSHKGTQTTEGKGFYLLAAFAWQAPFHRGWFVKGMANETSKRLGPKKGSVMQMPIL